MALPQAQPRSELSPALQPSWAALIKPTPMSRCGAFLWRPLQLREEPVLFGADPKRFVGGQFSRGGGRCLLPLRLPLLIGASFPCWFLFFFFPREKGFCLCFSFSGRKFPEEQSL